jgi:nitroreductase
LIWRKELVLTQEQVEQFLRSRRIIRNFKSQPVERHKLEKLLEIACFAPSAKNSQPWYWTVVEDPADVRRFAEMVIDWMRNIIAQFPEQAEVRGLPRVVAAWDAGQERICQGAPHIIVVHGDKEYGFGAEDGALGLPAEHRAFGAVMVGYPQLRYQRLPLRNIPRVSWR